MMLDAVLGSTSFRFATSSIGSNRCAQSWPQSSLCQMMSYWSDPEVSDAVIFSTYTPYELGTLTIFTPFFVASFSRIAREASWIGLGW